MAANTNTTFLKIEQVAERYNVSKDTIWRWRRKGDFPSPMKLSEKTVRWRLSDLEEWESRCVCALATSLTDLRACPPDIAA